MDTDTNKGTDSDTDTVTDTDSDTAVDAPRCVVAKTIQAACS